MTPAELLAAVEPVVRYHAARLARRYRDLSADDLAQEARIAVVQGHPKYDAKRCDARTYFRPRIVGAMLDAIRRHTETATRRRTGETVALATRVPLHDRHAARPEPPRRTSYQEFVRVLRRLPGEPPSWAEVKAVADACVKGMSGTEVSENQGLTLDAGYQIVSRYTRRVARRCRENGLTREELAELLGIG